MSAAHTPGPWSWVEVGDTGGDNPVPVFEVIAGNYERGAVRIAEHIADGDAQLIAASPDMLAALESLAAFAAREMGLPLEECVSGPIGQARVIIAKAKGE